MKSFRPQKDEIFEESARYKPTTVVIHVIGKLKYVHVATLWGGEYCDDRGRREARNIGIRNGGT
jgi:hypothetical protein